MIFLRFYFASAERLGPVEAEEILSDINTDEYPINGVEACGDVAHGLSRINRRWTRGAKHRA
jgi:hypothetical protein